MRATFWHVLIVLCTFSIISGCKSNKGLIPYEAVDIRNIDTVYVMPDPIPEPEYDSRQESYKSTFERQFDLLHTELDIAFDWQEEKVMGTADLLLTPVAYEQDTIILDAKKFNITSIHLSSQNKDQLKHSYSNNGYQIRIIPEITINTLDTIHVSIEYSATPAEDAMVNTGFSVSSDKGLFFIDPRDTDPLKPSQIWTQGETEHNSKWFPTIDKPNERCTQKIRLLVPDSMVSLSNGLLTSSEKLKNGLRADTWELDQPHAPYLFMIAIGKYYVEQNVVDGMAVDYYVEPQFADDAEEIFEPTPEMISFFSELLDYPFPWPKYAQVVVRDFVSGAMENTTASVFGQSVQKPAADLIDNGNDVIIAHELFHQWFGNLVTCESWANLTMNEGFANYSEYLWLEHKYGKDAADFHRMNELSGYLDESFMQVHPLIHFHYEDKEDMFDAHSYNKGGLVLHMLRDYLGDEVFFAGLNHYIHKMAYSSAEVHDLRLSFEAVSSRDLNWFFNQWYLSAGHPIIETKWKYDESSKTLNFLIDQTQEGQNVPDVFTFPLELDLIYNDGTIIRNKFWIDSRKMNLEIKGVGEPQIVLVDPQKLLLLQTEEKEPEFAELLYKRASSVENRLDAVDAMNPGIKTIEEILKDPFWAVRRSALKFLPESSADYKTRLLSLASNDPHARVRAESIAVLMENSKEISYNDILQIYHKDPSNLVRREAFRMLVLIDNEQAAIIAEELKESNSQLMLEGLGEYYFMNNVQNKDAFFARAVSLGSYETYFSIFPLWGAYLGKQDFDSIQNRLSKWEAELNDPGINDYYGLAILMALETLIGSSQQSDLTSMSKQTILKQCQKIYRASEHILLKFGY
jgi:aminopeptidase N